MTDKAQFFHFKNDHFQVDVGQTEIGVCQIKDEFFIRMDAGGAESVQIVFTKDDFAKFVDWCKQAMQ